MLPNVYTVEQQLMDQLECGIEQGIELGIELGRQKLIAEKRKSVRVLAEHGISAQLIAKSLHLSLEEVKQTLHL